jgi:hypothetical protein
MAYLTSLNYITIHYPQLGKQLEANLLYTDGAFTYTSPKFLPTHPNVTPVH